MAEGSTFPVHPTARFQGHSTSISRPKEIACFSYDDNHQYHADDRSLRYYYPPRLGVDFKRGFETFRQFNESQDEHLNSLLRRIVKHEESTGAKAEADVVTWRGMMTKIMACPYDDDGFEMHATRFQGTIFIEENYSYRAQRHAEQAKQRTPPGMPSQDMMSFWGYKFETLSTLRTSWSSTSREIIEQREDDIVDNHAQYCSIVTTAIGNTKLILGGEVDAVWDAKPERPEDTVNWVELKTSAVIESDRDMQKYERKLMKFWIQSFLLGVPKIVVGMRSKQGVLQQVEELETQKIPGMVKKRGNGTWDGNVCINYTAAFLEWLKTVITEDGVWLIRRERRSADIEMVKLQQEATGEILSGEFLRWRRTTPSEA